MVKTNPLSSVILQGVRPASAGACSTNTHSAWNGGIWWLGNKQTKITKTKKPRIQQSRKLGTCVKQLDSCLGAFNSHHGFPHGGWMAVFPTPIWTGTLQFCTTSGCEMVLGSGTQFQSYLNYVIPPIYLSLECTDSMREEAVSPFAFHGTHT